MGQHFSDQGSPTSSTMPSLNLGLAAVGATSLWHQVVSVQPDRNHRVGHLQGDRPAVSHDPGVDLRQLVAMRRHRPVNVGPLRVDSSRTVDCDGSIVWPARCSRRARQFSTIRSSSAFSMRSSARNKPAGLSRIIVDNFATHKHPKMKAWLTRHPRWSFHCTSTSGSWLEACRFKSFVPHSEAIRRGDAVNFLPQMHADARRWTERAYSSQTTRWISRRGLLKFSNRHKCRPVAFR